MPKKWVSRQAWKENEEDEDLAWLKRRVHQACGIEGKTFGKLGKRRKPSRCGTSYIYFVQSGDYIKIGQTRAPKERLSQLDSCNPEGVILLMLLQGDLKLERALGHDLILDS